MITNFENSKVVLTSQFPEAFINFQAEASDPCTYYIQPIRNTDIPPDTLFFNGLDINADPADSSAYYEPSIGWALRIEPGGDPSIASFHTYTREASTFDYSVTFRRYSKLLTDASGVSTIDAQLEWELINIPQGPFNPTDNHWGLNSFISVSGDGSIMTSTDGSAWSLVNNDGGVPNAETNTWVRAAYGNGVWVIVAEDSSFRAAHSSNNGLDWTAVNMPGGQDLQWGSVDWSQDLGQFLAIATGGEAGDGSFRAAISTDGSNWTSVNPFVGGNGNWQRSAWSSEASRWIIIANSASDNKLAAVSNDGVNWTNHDPIGGTINTDNIAAGRDEFDNPLWIVPTLSGGNFYSTNDGSVWFGPMSLPASLQYRGIAYAPDRNAWMVATITGALDGGNYSAISYDGSTWTNVGVGENWPHGSAFTYSIGLSKWSGVAGDSFGSIVPGGATLTKEAGTDFDVSILNRPYMIETENINYYETSNPLIEGDAAYMLLRTNPKFTGNVKVIADTSGNVFLDTFKVSSILSNRRFRKQQVSANSQLSADMRRVFSTLPVGELYRLDEDDTLDISIPETEFKEQFDTTYAYGARLLMDELYSQDYGLLAPLWLNNTVPDYFAIFRLDGVYNVETYDGDPLDALGNKYLINSELIKSYSFQELTPLGDYMNTHLEEALQFRAPVFLSLSDPASSDPDPNSWYGIAIDKGIVTGRSEIPFFFDKTTNNFTEMNAFVSQGFERNNLVMSNLINMEYIFNDDDVSTYEMNRYFGLYLTENPIYKVAYYSDTSTSNVEVISLDGNESSTFFASSVFGPSGDVSSGFETRIFALSHREGVKRITNKQDADGGSASSVIEFLSRPDKNIFNAEVEIKKPNRFVSLTVNNLLNAGEHLRIVNRTRGLIWEALGISNQYIEDGSAWSYASSYDPSPGYPKIYRSVFSVGGTINDQATAIRNAFSIFKDYEGTPFLTSELFDNNLSIILKDDTPTGDKYQFQRITSQTEDIPGDVNSPFNSSASAADITFYGSFTPTPNDFERVTIDASFGPQTFELYGNRRSIMFDMFDASSANVYSLDESFLTSFEDINLYQGVDSWFRRTKNLTLRTFASQNDVSTLVNNRVSYLRDPISKNGDKILVLTDVSIRTVNSRWNAFSIYPVNISLMGINPVKDLDFTVYDSSLNQQDVFESKYRYAREDDASTYEFQLLLDASGNVDLWPGSYEIASGTGTIWIGNDVSSYDVASNGRFKFNTFEQDACILTSTETYIEFNLLDGSASYFSYRVGASEENIKDYYEDPSTRKTLNYGLTIPEVTKWEGLGTDVRGNELRLLLDSSIILDGSSNFVPFNDEFTNEITYPVFKYLSPGTEAWKSYLFYDVNDSISYKMDSNDPSVYASSLRDFMFDNPTVDVFSKWVYSGKNTPGRTIRSSIAYFNQFKDTIDVIITGLNLSISVSSEAKRSLNAKDWDRYRFSFISTPSRNRSNNQPIELIINENTKTILMIWYQGSDDLNYNRRYSTYVGGKNFVDGSSGLFNFSNWQTNRDEGQAFRSNVKSPFIVQTDNAAGTISNVYGISTNGYDGSISSPYAQLNWNPSAPAYSIFNAYAGNEVNPASVFDFAVAYDTFLSVVDYAYAFETTTFSRTSYNWGYEYYSIDNHYVDNTTELSTLQYWLTNNFVFYHVIRGTTVFDNNTFVSKPGSISINSPKFYTPVSSSEGIYTYSGWFKPQFNDILNFAPNEEQRLIDVFEKDFVMGNTNYQSYSFIPQYWYNRVVDTVSEIDVSTANAINYIKDYNPFKALWDADYFIQGDASLFDGIATTSEKPSFFGSKLIKLPNEIEINTWTTSTAVVNTTDNFYRFSLNISRAIVDQFKANAIFIDNWAGLGDTEESVNNYVNDTIVSYYNVSLAKIVLNTWSKPYDGTNRISLVLDDDFEVDEQQNFFTELNYVNGEYIYTARTDVGQDKTYYFTFTLTEK